MQNEFMTRTKAIEMLGALARAQKEETHRRLVDAAAEVFETQGYIAPSIDDIARQAGVSRQTFYRHFDGKLAIATEYFLVRRANSLPYWRLIDEVAARDPVAVEAWLGVLFDSFHEQRHVLRAIIEMSMIEPSFKTQVRDLVSEVIETLARRIPAFAGTGGKSRMARERWTDAWLLIEQVMEQLNGLAMGIIPVEREFLLPALARQFVHFVEQQRG